MIELIVVASAALKSCSQLNYCSGHGRCVGNTRCECDDGYTYSYDCSARTCPTDMSWADLPQSTGTAHQIVECSGKGICDRKTGTCACDRSYIGASCDRFACPTKVIGAECSGHGQCMSMEMLATMGNAEPVSPAAVYRLQSHIDDVTKSSHPWDHDKIYGCLCDSAWSVGLGDGQTQLAEWFGPDCSLRRCPSGDNPMTTAIETNCSAITPPGYSNTSGVNTSHIIGKNGNLCHVECSNQGVCDYDTGVCSCFRGHYGESCGINAALYKPGMFAAYANGPNFNDPESVVLEPLDVFYGDPQ